MKRDELGRIVAYEDFKYFLNTDELDSYKDKRVKGNLLFPEHKENQSSPVTVTYLNIKK